MGYTAMKAAFALGLDRTPLEHGVEASSQSYLVGALLVNSSGKVAIGASDPSLGTILGVASVKATGTTDTDAPYTPALPHVVFEANFDDGSGTLALAQSHVNGLYGLAKDNSTGHFYVDQSDTTNIRVMVRGLRDAIGTVNGRVYFSFIPNAARASATAV
jgi:hypothetical protein